MSDLVRNIILIVAILFVFGLCFYLMIRLDHFFGIDPYVWKKKWRKFKKKIRSKFFE